MSEEVHLTGIDKVTTRDSHHVIHVEGVVDGRKVEGLVTVPDFQAKERQGRQALREFLTDGLSTIHEAQRERRR